MKNRFKDKDYKWTEADFQPKKKTSWMWEVVAYTVLYIVPLSVCYFIVVALSSFIRSL